MSGTFTVNETYEVQAIELGCGHTLFVTTNFITERKRDHQTFYCTHCASPRHWPGESDIEKLRSQLSAAQQREETLRQQRINLEEALAAEQRSKERLKRRVKNGVCPCCHRTVKQLAAHMKTKHPDFAGNGRGDSNG
jgi:hypothetical protein